MCPKGNPKYLQWRKPIGLPFPIKATVLAIAMVMVGHIAGCGYRFQGASAPEEATIEIPLLENKTVETGIETILTQSLILEMRKAPGWKVVGPGEGRYILKGSILKFISEPHAVSARHLAVEHRATLVVDISFKDKTTGKEIWRDRNLKSFADYPVGPDILGSERAKRDAISRIAAEFASRVRTRIQDSW